MRKVFVKNDSPVLLDGGILFIRVAISILMLLHGVPKLMKFFEAGPLQFKGVLGLDATLSLGLAVFAEVICSIFLILGFGTRIVLIPLMMTMLVAVLHIHAADPFVVKEKAILFLVSYVFLFFTGSGSYSVDAMMRKKRGKLAI